MGPPVSIFEARNLGGPNRIERYVRTGQVLTPGAPPRFFEADKLREEGKECIWTLGLDDHSNALYRKAGFEEVGKTPRKELPVFMKRLR